MDTFSARAVSFYKDLTAPSDLPEGVEALEPHRDREVMKYTETFLKKFFSDNKKRVLVLGINPGRFGSNMTGVPFTDPIALRDNCGIPNIFDPRSEASSRFLYKFIDTWGGAEDFYAHFFVSAVCPIGFTKEGKNYNYYDDPILYARMKPFIVSTLQRQVDLGVSNTAILLGTGKNQKTFLELNKELGLFKRVLAVEHPRFIMQYKNKHMDDYLEKYQSVFTEVLGTNK